MELPSSKLFWGGWRAWGGQNRVGCVTHSLTWGCLSLPQRNSHSQLQERSGGDSSILLLQMAPRQGGGPLYISIRAPEKLSVKKIGKATAHKILRHKVPIVVHNI